MLIPIILCFDDNYSIPAGVAIYSLLENADKRHEYIFHVMHSNISSANQIKLEEVVDSFSNAVIEFKLMGADFNDLFSKIKHKTHYTKEMFYKFIAPSIFSEYEKIIITDVDVVFLGDVSLEFIKFSKDEDYCLAAIQNFMPSNSWITENQQAYMKDFSEAERKALVFGAGYYIYNVQKLLRSDCASKFVEYAFDNIHRLRQPEQDVINIICEGKIKPLPPSSMVCAYLYEIYTAPELYSTDLNYSADQIDYALKKPVQLHYATGIKPWNTPASAKSQIWFQFLFKTPFATDYLEEITPKLRIANSKTLCKFKVPFSKRNFVEVKKIRI